jgi:hypothetical protein
MPFGRPTVQFITIITSFLREAGRDLEEIYFSGLYPDHENTPRPARVTR